MMVVVGKGLWLLWVSGDRGGGEGLLRRWIRIMGMWPRCDGCCGCGVMGEVGKVGKGWLVRWVRGNGESGKCCCGRWVRGNGEMGRG